MNGLFVLILFGLMHALRSFTEPDVASSTGIALALGYLLLTAHFVGKMFARLRLPKLTGYLVTGIAVGPAALGLISEPMVESLRLVNGMAVALIALSAGTELNLKAMRPLFRSIAWLTLCAVVGTAGVLAIAVMLARPWLPFLASMSLVQVAALAGVLGTVMAAQSPAVVVALKNEMRADGVVSRTVLGVVVIADLVVILLFTLASTGARAALGTRADAWSTVGPLAWELLGSLGIGAVLGLLLSLYIRKVRAGEALFLLTVTFIIAEVGQRLHLDPLLTALAAGVAIRNLTRTGDEVHGHIEVVSLPVYTLFFAVAGTAIHLEALATIGLPALFFVLVRGGGILAGARLGARLSGAPAAVRRHVGFGLLPQAGLAIALATIFSKTFPELGASAGALVLAVVAINEVVAPALYRMALVRSGEVGRARAELPQGLPAGATLD